MTEAVKNAEDYVKTILYFYPHIRAYSEAVGVSVKNKAALSFQKSDVFAAALPIVSDKFLLDALKRLHEDALALFKAFSKEERYLLAYKYFRREEEAVPLTYSERSYYRKQNALLKKTAAGLKRAGWTEERFLCEFGECGFIMKILKAVRTGRERELVKKRAVKTLSFYTKSSSSRLGAGDLRAKNTTAATAAAAKSATQMSAI